MKREPRLYSELDKPMDPKSIADRQRRRERLILFAGVAFIALILIWMT